MQAGNEWANILPKSLQVRKKPPPFVDIAVCMYVDSCSLEDPARWMQCVSTASTTRQVERVESAQMDISASRESLRHWDAWRKSLFCSSKGYGQAEYGVS